MNNNKDFEIHNGVLIRYKGNDTCVVIPDGVVRVGNFAFFSDECVVSVTIPNSVTIIGSEAFSFCNKLESVVIPSSVTTIGDSAFFGCSNLKNINFPERVCIYHNAFAHCSSLTSVTIPSGTKSIERGVFRNCENLESVTIPDGVTSIGDYAFSFCKLTSIAIPDSVDNIGEYAFYGCSNLRRVWISDNIASIGEYAFDIVRVDNLSTKIKVMLGWKQEENKLAYAIQYANNGNVVYKDIDSYMERKMVSLVSYSSRYRSVNILNKLFEINPKKLLNNIRNYITDNYGIQAVTDFLVEWSGSHFDSNKIEEALYEAAECRKKSMSVLSAYSKAVLDDLAERKLDFTSLFELLKQYYSLTQDDLPEITYTNGDTVPGEVVAWLLMAHENYDPSSNEVVVSYNKAGLNSRAEEVLSYIEMNSFQSALLILASKNLGLKGYRKKMFLAYPICRYADDSTMSELLKQATKWKYSSRGDITPSFKTFRKACAYSDCDSVTECCKEKNNPSD